ncbi:MAG: DUF2934 domain-containing protein [Opitutus sp.]
MKSKLSEPAIAVAPTEDEIRDYAQHLYEQSGCQQGHDVENWLEAKACLEAHIPKHETRARLHRQRDRRVIDCVEIAAVEVRRQSLNPMTSLENRRAGGVLLRAPKESSTKR